MIYTSKLFLLSSLLIILSSCSVYMAANQPDKKNLNVLENGTSRGLVIAELGAPVHSEVSDNGKMDVFKFIQGYSDGNKFGRAFVHGTADFFTLGLWEIIGTPIEGIADGTEIILEVYYDENNKVREFKTISGEDKKIASSADVDSNKKQPLEPINTDGKFKSTGSQAYYESLIKIAVFPWKFKKDADLMQGFLNNEIMRIAESRRDMFLSHSFYKMDRRYGTTFVGEEYSILKNIDKFWDSSTPRTIKISEYGSEMGVDAAIIGEISITNPWSDHWKLGNIDIYLIDVRTNKVLHVHNLSKTNDARDELTTLLETVFAQYLDTLHKG